MIKRIHVQYVQGRRMRKEKKRMSCAAIRLYRASLNRGGREEEVSS